MAQFARRTSNPGRDGDAERGGHDRLAEYAGHTSGAVRCVGRSENTGDLVMSFMHQIMSLVRPGRLTADSDESGTCGSAQVMHSRFETRSIPHLQHTGFASGLPTGTDVMVINCGGDQANGAVIASGHQSFRPKNLAAGEVTLYDCPQTDGQAQQSIKLASDGSIVISGCHTVVITADTSATITVPQITIDGELRVTGAITAGYGGADQVGVQTHTHSHGPAPDAGT